MRSTVLLFVFVLLVFPAGNADAQLIVDDFDSQTTGSPPAWQWWENGRSGTIQVDDTVYRGSSGRSVELVRTTFDDYTFSFGRNFRPLDGPAELTFFFRVSSTTEEVLTAVGGNNSGHQVAWWIGVGGAVGNAIGTYSETGGWNHVMDVVADTWYGVRLEIDPTTFTYDITVWEDGNPGNTATETGIPFRNGTAVEVIDQIQFGNFSAATSGPAASAFVDDVKFVGTRILNDDFESGNTGYWSSSTRPLTAVTTCYQTVTTDAYLANDLNCDSSLLEAVAVEIGASNIFLDLNGHTMSHTIPDQTVGIGVDAQNVEGITVKNGTIKDFLVGVNLRETSTATVKDLWIGNLVEDDPVEFLPGVRVTLCKDVVVRDTFFEYLPVAHKEAIVNANSDIVVDNIEVRNASVGLNYGGWCNGERPRSSGSIINGRLFGVTIAGVLVQCTDDALIADNEFSFNEAAISVDTTRVGGTTGLVIDANVVNRGFIGVHLMGSDGVSILDNTVRNVWRGIFLDAIMGCPETGTAPGCYHATGNVISGNTATGSIFDLYHHELALGNTWTNNICQTKEGAEIPPCTGP